MKIQLKTLIREMQEVSRDTFGEGSAQAGKP